MATIGQEFQAATGASVSNGILRTETHQLGYSRRSAAHKSHIAKRNKSRRLRWRLHLHNWTCMSLRLPRERVLHVFIVPIMKFGGGVLKLWGCFWYYDVGPLGIVHDTMNSQAYCTILDNGVLPTLLRLGMDSCSFQDVIACYYVSKASMTGPHRILPTVPLNTFGTNWIGE